MSAAISTSDPLFGLRVTERIEVYSEIKTQENSPTGTRTKSVKMWWPGVVTALKYEATTTAMILKMEVKYEPLPEYNLLAATESATVSSNNRMKEVSTGAEYEWRLQEKGVTQDDALLLYNYDNEDASEEEYTPPSRTNIQSRRKTPSAQDGRRKLTAKEVQDREMNFLRSEVQCMEELLPNTARIWPGFNTLHLCGCLARCPILYPPMQCIPVPCNCSSFRTNWRSSP